MADLPLPFPASTITLDYGDTDRPYSAWSPHQGTDFSSRSQGVVAGATIRASATGVVHRAGWETGEQTPTMDRPNKNAGNSIDVDYPSAGVRVRYMHRPTSSPSPAAGDRVTEGASLGVVGDTGYVTAAHLHMETWDLATGRRVNPANYFDFTRTVTTGQTADDGATPFPLPEEADMSEFILQCPTRNAVALVAPGTFHVFTPTEHEFWTKQAPEPLRDIDAYEVGPEAFDLCRDIYGPPPQASVALSGEQLQQIADAAKRGGVEAVKGLTFVVQAGSN